MVSVKSEPSSLIRKIKAKLRAPAQNRGHFAVKKCVSAQVPPSAFSNSEGLVLSRRSCDQLTRCTQLTWCYRGESESTPGWHRPASFSRKTPPYGRKTSL